MKLKPNNIEPFKALAEVFPEHLAEGPLLVDFKDDEDTDIKSAVIVTLHPDMCPINTIPDETGNQYCLWAWNVRRNEWLELDCKTIDTVQVWPPQD